LKEEIVKLKNQISISKQSNDQKLFDLRNQNDSLKEMLNYKTNELNNKISDVTRENTELKAQLSNLDEELVSLRTLNVDFKNKLTEFKNLKTEFEQEKNSHQNALLKIKELEYEVDSYGDWKEVAKASQSRMSNMSEMEKEVTRLKQANKNLHDSLGNKLLMEEQVHSLQTRLERYEQSSLDQIALKSQIDSLEKELKDWKKLGADFVQKGAANNPINVRTYVENLLHRDLLLMSEKSSVSTEKTSIQNQLSELRSVSILIMIIFNQCICYLSHHLFPQQNEAATKQTETLEKSLKNYQSVIMKLQKKIRLVQSERDAQRQLLDSYERDLTMTQGPQTTHANESQYKLRIEMLTESVNGYKELCAKMEAENAELRGINPTDSTVCTTEQYKNLRKDLEAVRVENEKLRKRKNELEIEIENFTLRNNTSHEEHFKVLHFKNNPAAIAQQQIAEEVTKLKAEIERLRIRNRKLEEGNDDLTVRVNETMNVTLNIKELQKLREEHKTLEAKCQENEKLFARVNQELREVVYMLFGYKLDRYGNSNYRYN
jgi:mitotic spindle assembly checkpoint protein MAD1